MEEREFILNILNNVENINSLPKSEEIIELSKKESDIDYKDILSDVFDIFNEEIEITLKDGTIVQLLSDDNCAKCDDFHNYYIPEIKTYVCLECGTWQKYNTDIFSKVYEECKENGSIKERIFYEEKKLPCDWSKNGIEKYFKNGLDYAIKKYYENNTFNEYY